MPVVAILPAAIVSAIFALVFLLTYGKFRDAIHENFHFNVGIGPFTVDLLSWVVDGTDYLYAVMLAVFDGWLDPLVHFILDPIANVENTFTAAKNAVAQLSGAVYNLYYTVLPVLGSLVASGSDTAFGNIYLNLETLGNNVLTEVSTLQSWVQTWVNDRLSGLQTEVNNITTYVQDILNEGVTSTIDVADLATTAAQSVVAAAAANIETDISAALSTAEAFTNTVQGDLLRDIANALTQAEAFTTTAISALPGALAVDIPGAITAGLSGLWTDIDGAITDTIGVIGTGDAAIRDALGRIDWTIPANLTALASLVGVTTLTMARYLRDCGIPNCQNLSQLGKDVQALLGLANDAAFLGLLVGLVEHPSTAAATIDSTFGGAINDTVGAFRALVSI